MWVSGDLEKSILKFDPRSGFIIDNAMLPSFVRVERCLSRPNRTSRSGAKCKRVKSRVTCLSDVPKRRHHRHPQKNLPPMVAIGPQVWAKSVHWFDLQRWPIDFCKGLRDHTWHVPRATDRPASGTIFFPPFWCIEWIFARTDRTSRSGSRGENDWTHTWTDKHRRLLFSSDPPEEIFEQKFSMLKHWSLLLYDFE